MVRDSLTVLCAESLGLCSRLGQIYLFIFKSSTASFAYPWFIRYLNVSFYTIAVSLTFCLEYYSLKSSHVERTSPHCQRSGNNKRTKSIVIYPLWDLGSIVGTNYTCMLYVLNAIHK